MALEKSRFFDSVGDDRTYQADDFAEFFRMLFTDGIRNGGTNLKVLASGTGMTVHVNYGEAFVQGYPYWLEDNNTGLLPLTIGTASLSQPRIDRVILHLKWIPNYVSLSKESRKTRALVESKPWTGKKCVIFQSAHDELVSSKSEKLLTGLGCDVDILENSSHHQYSQTDGEKLVQAFHAWLK
jgi:hypothetical protein